MQMVAVSNSRPVGNKLESNGTPDGTAKGKGNRLAMALDGLVFGCC